MYFEQHGITHVAETPMSQKTPPKSIHLNPIGFTDAENIISHLLCYDLIQFKFNSTNLLHTTFSHKSAV